VAAEGLRQGPRVPPDDRAEREPLGAAAAQGRAALLGIPAKFRGWTWNTAAFEDPATVIVVPDTAGRPYEQTMFRCRVTTGECKALLTAKNNESLALVQP